ncbi:CCA tRNA nucleotidyltransferase [Roseobacter sp. YSTF-M11]|uniref:CCA tRNA nucleotidyltransferase n=1 Tax=Roseobacter insulae TaxID=2859783 RepID=A0A9X1JX12_9RHOB|nr:CCA tRNA nucleotidyltransferase [Roseobacter insulae]MBW4706740.1 CCA tRNA nucleotidyltransferase [Roseobacter insulae]
MDRPDFTVVPTDTHWLTDPGAQAVCRAVSARGAQIYFVGGCVRDAVLGIPGADVDMATDALPQDVTGLAEAADLKVVPTGIDHGTVTIVAHGTGYEVTTFRRDIKTDGRHAEVVFSKDISEDARRRDFTLNALYATPGGTIVDPLGGLPDCLARRIRFIEDAGARIREDYLRALRFFRFHAWYADPEAGFDVEALDAIAQNAAGVEKLSAERIGAEVSKLLAAPDPVQCIATMQHTGLLQRVLPGSDITLLGPVVHNQKALGLRPDWRVRLAALGGEGAKARLRMSSKDAKVMELLQSVLGNMMPIPEVAYRYGETIAAGALVLGSALASQPVVTDDLDPIKKAAVARFPIKAQDLMPALSGKALGDRLGYLERRWIASQFRLTREELMTLE